MYVGVERFVDMKFFIFSWLTSDHKNICENYDYYFTMSKLVLHWACAMSPHKLNMQIMSVFNFSHISSKIFNREKLTVKSYGV